MRRIGRDRTERAQGRFDPSSSAFDADPHVDLGRCAAGTTFGVVPPLITPTLIVVPAARSCKCLEAQDLVGQLHDGAAAFSGSDPGVGGPP